MFEERQCKETRWERQLIWDTSHKLALSKIHFTQWSMPRHLRNLIPINILFDPNLCVCIYIGFRAAFSTANHSTLFQSIQTNLQTNVQLLRENHAFNFCIFLVFFSCHNRKREKMSFNSCVISLLGFHFFLFARHQKQQYLRKGKEKNIFYVRDHQIVAERKFDLLLFIILLVICSNKYDLLSLRTRRKGIQKGKNKKGKNASTSIATFKRERTRAHS